ncbi:MAG: hypothetical protein ABSA16_09945 [Thermoguttaceae bacterium]|jgi:hypothetical protein
MPLEKLFDFECQRIYINGCPPSLAHLYQDEPPPGDFPFHPLREADKRLIQEAGKIKRILYHLPGFDEPKWEESWVIVEFNSVTHEAPGRFIGLDEAEQFQGADTSDSRGYPVAPDAFSWDGVLHSGLAEKPFRAVQYLWEQNNKTAHNDELAEYVYEDTVELIPDNAIGGLRREINRFFRNEKIPLHAVQSNGCLTLRDGPPRPVKTKPKKKKPGR